MAAFSYSDEVSGPEWYETLLKRFAALFVRYRIKYPAIRNLSLDKQFKRFWIAAGPTGFKTNEDALRFRKELFNYIETHIDQGDMNVRPEREVVDSGEPQLPVGP